MRKRQVLLLSICCFLTDLMKDCPQQSTPRSFHCWDEELYYNSHSSHRRNKNRFGVLPSLLLQKHIRKFWLKMKRSYCSHFTSSIWKIPLKLAGNRKIIFLNLTVRKNILQKCMKKRYVKDSAAQYWKLAFTLFWRWKIQCMCRLCSSRTASYYSVWSDIIFQSLVMQVK